MILNTSDFSNCPGLTGCSLSQSALGGSTLSLELAVEALPDWARDLGPVSLLHGGNPLFCGCITSITMANEGGRRRWAITVQDYWYLLENQAAAAQLSQISAQAQDMRLAPLREALHNMTQSWADLARHLRISVSGGWTCNSHGEPTAGIISVDTGLANYSFTPAIGRDRVYSSREILGMMSECNPDCLFYSSPGGLIRVMAMSRCPVLTLPFDKLTTAQIAPDHRGQVTGVCVALTVARSDINRAQMLYRTYPGNVSINSTGVRCFSSTFNVDGPVFASAINTRMQHLLSQATAWYNAVRQLQHTGSVEAPLELFPDDSPIAKVLHITGPGAPAEWGTMMAPVTAVDWDFTARRVTLTLGKDIVEPMLHELETIPVDDSDYDEPSESPSVHIPSKAKSDSQSVSQSQSESESQSQAGGGCDCEEKWKIVDENFQIIQEKFAVLVYIVRGWDWGGPADQYDFCEDLKKLDGTSTYEPSLESGAQ